MDNIYLLEITKGHGKGSYVRAANEDVGEPVLAFFSLRGAEESAIEHREYYGIIAKPVAVQVLTRKEEVEKCQTATSPSTP